MSLTIHISALSISYILYAHIIYIVYLTLQPHTGGGGVGVIFN